MCLFNLSKKINIETDARFESATDKVKWTSYSESYKYGTDEKHYMKGHFKGFTLVMEVVSNPP